MMKDNQHISKAAHAKKRSVGQLIAQTIAVLLFISLIGFAAFYAYSSLDNTAFSHTSMQQPSSDTFLTSYDNSASSSIQNTNLHFEDRSLTRDQLQAQEEQKRASQEAEAAAHDGFPIPVVAEYDGVLIHSPVHSSELEGILFHQAATEVGLPMTTQLPEANVEEIEKNPNYEIEINQAEDEVWLHAKALHLWRDDTETAMDTSIDVGAEAGTPVYAPVTGTVILVRTYELYETCTDYEIHIQPEGRDDIDIVLIHVSDVEVEPGKAVVGGETPIAKVRNLASEDITDIQLAYYTKEGHGNHTHVQVNDANYPEYRETRLKDAYKPK